MARTKPTHYEIRITVEGNGSFPVDMLRYDSCVPATEVDSHQIDRHGEQRQVTLRRFVKVGCTHFGAAARWKAYGWPIIKGVDLDNRLLTWDGPVEAIGFSKLVRRAASDE